MNRPSHDEHDSAPDGEPTHVPQHEFDRIRVKLEEALLRVEYSEGRIKWLTEELAKFRGVAERAAKQTDYNVPPIGGGA